MQEDSRQPRKWDVFHFASSNFVKLKTDHPNSELEIFFKLCKSYCFNSTAHNRTWQDARQVTFVAEALNFSARWHVMQPDNLLVLFSFRSIHFLTCGQCLHAVSTYCRLTWLLSVTSPCMFAFGAWTIAESKSADSRYNLFTIARSMGIYVALNQTERRGAPGWFSKTENGSIDHFIILPFPISLQDPLPETSFIGLVVSNKH